MEDNTKEPNVKEIALHWKKLTDRSKSSGVPITAFDALLFLGDYNVTSICNSLIKCIDTLERLESGYAGMFGAPGVNAKDEAWEMSSELISSTLKEIGLNK